MSDVPLPFTAFLLILTLLGIAGNLRFIYCNYKQHNLHKQLLVFLAVLQTIGCVLELGDAVRILLGVQLTRVSCLHFTGAAIAAISFAIGNLYALLGVEVIILISSPSWYRKIKIWWFHVVVFSTFFLSGWWIYKSGNDEEDKNVLVCIPPTALTKEVHEVRSKWILISNCFILLQYVLILVMLLVKRNNQRSSYTTKIIKSSLILMVVFIFSWFLAVFLIVFASHINRMLNIPVSYILFTIVITAMSSWCQTHYVYFFIRKP